MRSRSTRPNRATASRQRSRKPESRSQAYTTPKRRVNAHVIRPIPAPISTSTWRCRVLAGEAEGVEVHRDLGVAGGDELGERLRVAGLAVEHPAGGLDDVVGALLAVGQLPGDLPGEELRAARHHASVAEARRTSISGSAALRQRRSGSGAA